MFRAMAVKELRETIGFALAGVAVMTYFVYGMIRQDSLTSIPFNGDSFSKTFAGVFGTLAIALGLRQSVWERIRGTFLFLFHRPARRGAILAAKIVTGVILLELTALLPFAWYAHWASTPGTHASPFAWWMTDSTWKIWFSLPGLYLGAFLVGLRPARWFGTRLLLIPTCLIVLLIVSQTSWWGTLLGDSLLWSTLIAVIFYTAATSDFG